MRLVSVRQGAFASSTVFTKSTHTLVRVLLNFKRPPDGSDSSRNGVRQVNMITVFLPHNEGREGQDPIALDVRKATTLRRDPHGCPSQDRRTVALCRLTSASLLRASRPELSLQCLKQWETSVWSKLVQISGIAEQQAWRQLHR